MIYRHKNTARLVSLLVILMIILLAASSYINIPHKLSTFSEVFPKEKWILTTGSGGQVVSNLVDFSMGHTTKHDVLELNRGDFINAEIKYLKDNICIGDTVAVINSTDIYDNLVTAKGEYEVALAELYSGTSPEKESLINEAESELELVREKINEQSLLFERAEKLYEKSLCSQQEYEERKWSVDLLKIEESKITAQVENLKTGVKEEEIILLKARLNAVSSRIQVLKEKEERLTIISPISGRINSSFNPDTILTVINDKQVVLYTPIRITDLSDIAKGQKLQVSFASCNITLRGLVLHVNRNVKIIDNQQVVFVSMLFENNTGTFIPGMVVENSMYIKDITLFDSIIRFLST